jgi:hypothetical protein
MTQTIRSVAQTARKKRQSRELREGWGQYSDEMIGQWFTLLAKWKKALVKAQSVHSTKWWDFSSALQREQERRGAFGKSLGMWQ